VLAIGAGAQRSIVDRVTAMGTNLLIVRPGQRGTGGVMSGTQQNLTLDDGQALLRQVKDIKMLAPVVGRGVNVKHFGRNTQTSLVGTSATYLPIRNFQIESGRVFSEWEVEHFARV